MANLTEDFSRRKYLIRISIAFAFMTLLSFSVFSTSNLMGKANSQNPMSAFASMDGLESLPFVFDENSAVASSNEPQYYSMPQSPFKNTITYLDQTEDGSSDSSGSRNEESGEENTESDGAESQTSSGESASEGEPSYYNSTVTEPVEEVKEAASSGNATETTTQVTTSGEPLTPSSDAIKRSFSYPALTFQDDVVSERVVNIIWFLNSIVEITDDRGYRYAMQVPIPEGGTFTLLSNSTIIDQKVVSDGLQYDIYWRPLENEDGVVDKYKFDIVGTSASESKLDFSIDSHKPVRFVDGKTIATEKSGIVGNSTIISKSYANDTVYANSTDAPAKEDEGESPRGLGIDWSDATSSGYAVNFDPLESKIEIPVGTSFYIDPTVTVASDASPASPPTISEFRNENRIISLYNGTVHRIYVFFVDGDWKYRYSDDNGETWSVTGTVGIADDAGQTNHTVVPLTIDGVQYLFFFTYDVSGNDTAIFHVTKGTVDGVDITWGSAVESFRVSYQSHRGVVPAFDTNGNIYVVYSWEDDNTSTFSYIIRKSSDLGTSWSTSLTQVNGIASDVTAALTPLEDGKMLFTYSEQDDTYMKYRVFDGSTWGTEQSITGTGMVAYDDKHVSAVSSLSTGYAYVAYASDEATPLKVASFLTNGTFVGIETADSTLLHQLPSTEVDANGNLIIATLVGSDVYVTRKINGIWETPFIGFYGPGYAIVDRLTAAMLADGGIGFVGENGAGDKVIFAMLEPGTVNTSHPIQNSPAYNDYFEGQKRIVSNINGTFFAFYYDGSNIVYKKSFDDGKTWSATGTSTGTGTIATDNFRWSLAHTMYNGTDRVALLYYTVSGSNTDFYQKTFKAMDTGLELVSTVNSFSAANEASCSTGVCAAAIGATDSNTNLDGGLVGSWWFDGDALDYSGNNNNGTLYGNATYATGKYLDALTLDGDGDYISVPHSSSLAITGTITMSAWIKFDVEQPSQNTAIITKQGGKYELLQMSNGDIRFRILSGGQGKVAYIPESDYATGTWYHIVGTYDNSKVRLYLNGVEYTGDSYSGSIDSSSDPFFVGYDGGTGIAPGNFDGMVDNLRLYNRALNKAEVQNLYLDNGDNALYAAYRWKSGGTWHYKVLKSTDGGSTWSTSLDTVDVTTTSNRVPMTMTYLNNSTKMLLAYATYESGDLNYRVFDGYSWGSVNTIGAGITTNRVKQLSSGTIEPEYTNGTMTAYVAFLAGGNQGDLKVAKFAEDGTYETIETADTTIVHWLPSVTVTSDGTMHVYTLYNGIIYDTQKNTTGWQAPTAPYGTDFYSPDQLTSQLSGKETTSVLWRSGTSLYQLRFAGEIGGTVDTTGNVVSPGLSESYSGQKRIIRTSNALFAFYYDGKNIVYKYSKDNGMKWNPKTASSAGTGKLGADYQQWTIATAKIGSTKYVTLLYWKQNGSTTEFYAKRGTIGTSSISWSSATLLFSKSNQSGCSNGVCASVTAAADSNGNLYAAFKWKYNSSTYKYRIYKSTDGGSAWTSSLAETSISTTNAKMAFALTRLASGNMLFAYSLYNSGDINYRVLTGSTWGSIQTISAASTGMSSNTAKQMSADSDSTGKPYLVYVTKLGGTLKVINWTNTGSSPIVQTADSTKKHYLPSITIRPNDDLIHVYSITDKWVTLTRKIFDTWLPPMTPYAPGAKGTGKTNADQFTIGWGLDGQYAPVMWTEGSKKYTIRESGIKWAGVAVANDCWHPADSYNFCIGTEIKFHAFAYITPVPGTPVTEYSCGTATCEKFNYKISYPVFDPTGTRNKIYAGGQFAISYGDFPNIVKFHGQDIIINNNGVTILPVQNMIRLKYTNHYNTFTYVNGLSITLLQFVTPIPFGYQIGTPP